MNSNHDMDLELEISRELNRLPDLQAPASLISQVLNRIARAEDAPWYRRPWQTWPLPAQGLAFVVLIALFLSLCLGGWELSRTQAIPAAMNRAGEWLSPIATCFNIISVIANSGILALKTLGPGILAALLGLVAAAYCSCIGLGTLCFRLSFAKR